MRWAAAIPLIGGGVVAARNITGVDPAAIISYTPFAGNDENLRKYLPNVPYYALDEANNGFDVGAHQDLDFVQALCPCAGLSRLSNGSPEQRAKMNSWMIETARFVTEELRPKVFWGENAPGLFTPAGDVVKSQLLDQAKKAGYSFSLYLTDTSFHGVPQKRKRTFYFFWRDTQAPYLAYYDKPHLSLGEYLKQVPPGIKHHEQTDVDHAISVVENNPYMKFMRSKYGAEAVNQLRNFKQNVKTNKVTLFSYLIQTNQMGEMVTWLRDNNFPRQEKEAARIKNVIDDGKGFWDGSFHVFSADDCFGTVMSRTLYTIHPTEDRLMTPREFMHLMALPNDFELASTNINHICQNVPVCTAEDMTREVVAYLKGERDISRSNLLLQNNFKQTVVAENNSLIEF